MAKKRGGFGRFLGAITGTPYERLLKQVDKLVDQYDEDDDELANQLEALVDQAGDAYEEETIDEESTTSSSRPLKKPTRRVVCLANLAPTRTVSTPETFPMLPSSSEKSVRTWTI